MFIITKDLINVLGEKATGHVYVNTMSDDKRALIARLKPACVHKFRLLDDDSIVYLYGLCNHFNDERAFQPLDYYMYDLGVTSIEYRVNGVWIKL